MADALPFEERIGEVIREVLFPIERGKIAEFARAMRDPDPIYHDDERGRAAGLGGVPAPLTFSVAAAHYAGGDAMALPRALGLNLKRLVHGEHRWDYHRPIVAGDVLSGRTRIVSVQRKPVAAGVMTQVTLTTDYRDAAGNAVLSETMLLIELPNA